MKNQIRYHFFILATEDNETTGKIHAYDLKDNAGNGRKEEWDRTSSKIDPTKGNGNAFRGNVLLFYCIFVCFSFIEQIFIYI